MRNVSMPVNPPRRVMVEPDPVVKREQLAETICQVVQDQLQTHVFSQIGEQSKQILIFSEQIGFLTDELEAVRANSASARRADEEKQENSRTALSTLTRQVGLLRNELQQVKGSEAGQCQSDTGGYTGLSLASLNSDTGMREELAQIICQVVQEQQLQVLDELKRLAGQADKQMTELENQRSISKAEIDRTGQDLQLVMVALEEVQRRPRGADQSADEQAPSSLGPLYADRLARLEDECANNFEQITIKLEATANTVENNFIMQEKTARLVYQVDEIMEASNLERVRSLLSQTMENERKMIGNNSAQQLPPPQLPGAPATTLLPGVSERVLQGPTAGSYRLTAPPAGPSFQLEGASDVAASPQMQRRPVDNSQPDASPQSQGRRLQSLPEGSTTPQQHRFTSAAPRSGSVQLSQPRMVAGSGGRAVSQDFVRPGVRQINQNGSAPAAGGGAAGPRAVPTPLWTPHSGAVREDASSGEVRTPSLQSRLGDQYRGRSPVPEVPNRKSIGSGGGAQVPGLGSLRSPSASSNRPAAAFPLNSR